MPPTITGVDFVVVPTDAFDAAVAFYGDVLGLPCIDRYGKMPGAEFQAGNLTLAVMEAKAFGRTSGPTACRSRCRSTTSRRRARSSKRPA
jgi:catechol 2,3-dioxygenase-like lactoylglutathione lyase family enzyme